MPPVQHCLLRPHSCAAAAALLRRRTCVCRRSSLTAGGFLVCPHRPLFTRTPVRRHDQRENHHDRVDTDVTAAEGLLDTATYFYDVAATSPIPPAAPSAPQPPPAPAAVSAADWADFQDYLREVEASDPEFLAFARGCTPALPDEDEGVRGGDAGWTGDTATHAPTPPYVSPADAAELQTELAQEVVLDTCVSPEAAAHASGVADYVFGDDIEQDAVLLAALKGREVRVQEAADTTVPPLVIPDKQGLVRSSAAAPHAPGAPADRVANASVALRGPVQMLGRHSYLSQQDRCYMGLHTPPEAQLQPPPSLSAPSAIATSATTSGAASPCVLVVFSATDLRVHDNYLLALASVRARAATAASVQAGGPPVPVLAVCVLDYRTFAQPSVVGGFFRQSPQRAQYLLDTVSALRWKLETSLQVPLLVRCGRPEEHVPRLAVELGAVDVFMTTQYAPHERRVQALMTRRLQAGVWVSRDEVADAADGVAGTAEEVEEVGVGDDALVAVTEHVYSTETARAAAATHPYREHHRHLAHHSTATLGVAPVVGRLVVHSVWQSTLVHLDDLLTPLAAMKEGERWYHDDVTVSTIRPTEPYDAATQRLAELPTTWQHAALLPSQEELRGRAAPSVLRGALPRLVDLGYSAAAVHGTDFAFQHVIATQSSHPDAGEDAAQTRLDDWLAQGGMTSLLRYGRERRTNTKLYSQKLARVSPYLAVGALSPRRYYETLRRFAQAHQADAFVQMQFREGLLRLSRRDYWHWMGLRFGDRLFFSYGPHPEHTDQVADWRHDAKVVQRWCDGLTGIPFADAAMRELVGTGFVAHEGRQALAWLLTRGYGQDWRLGAEWMERCSLDYDPFVCYGNFAYSCGLVPDDFGEPVRNVHYLAHQHDQTGIYVKKWLPQLSKVPPVYVHRPHVLTARMQAMHGVYLGKNYPYPLKLWQGAQRTLSAADLPSYYAGGIDKGPGYAEAVRYGAAMLQPEEFSAAVSPAYVQARKWAALLPETAFAGVAEGSATEALAYVHAAPRQLPPPQCVRSADASV